MTSEGRPGLALLLRPWAESDAPGLREAIDEDLGHLKPWLGWTLEEPASPDRTRLRLRRWIDRFHRERGFRYAITPRDRPSVILGGAGLNRRLGPGAYTVGYWVRGSATRRGIGSAAVARLVVHAFEERGLDRLVIECDVANARSAAFARALGFDATGRGQRTYPDGSPRPVLRFEMTREDYGAHHAGALRDRACNAALLSEIQES